jgi:hypothetical protein
VPGGRRRARDRRAGQSSPPPDGAAAPREYGACARDGPAGPTGAGGPLCGERTVEPDRREPARAVPSLARESNYRGFAAR